MSRRIRILVEEKGEVVKEYSFTTDLQPWQIVSQINQTLDSLAVQEENRKRAEKIVEDMYEHPEKYGLTPLPKSKALLTSGGDVVIPRPLPNGNVKYEKLLDAREIRQLDEAFKKKKKMDTAQVAKLLGVSLKRAEIKLLYYAKLRGYTYDRGEVYAS